MKQILFVLIAYAMVGASTKQSPTPAVHLVRIEGMRFIPKSLEVNVGETVRWVNESSASHNVVANDESFKSKMLHARGEKFEYTFTSVGEFQYYCEPHRSMRMKGAIIVRNNKKPQ